MRVALPALLVLALAALLRLQHAASREGVWRDEAQDFFLVAGSASLGDLVWKRLAHEGHPPLHYVLEYGVQKAFGGSARAVRGMTVVLGVLGVALLMALARRIFGAPAALLAGLLMATSPFFIYYSAEMRAYALFLVISLVHVAVFLRFLARPSPGTACAWGVAAALLLATHYYGVYMIAPAGLFALARDPSPRLWRLVALAALACLLAFAPWLPQFAVGLRHDLQPWYVTKPQLRGAYQAWTLPLGLWGGLILLWGIVRGVFRIREPAADPATARAMRALLWMGAGGPLLAWIAQFIRGPFLPRYLIGMSVLLLPCAAWHWSGLFRADRVRRRIAWVLVALALVTQRTDPLKWFRTVSPSAEFSARIEAHARPDDLILISPAFFGPALNFHYEGGLAQLAPPYEGRLTCVDWIDLVERERDADLVLRQLDRLEAHLRAGKRVWMFQDALYPTHRRWALSDRNSGSEQSTLVRQELQIHRRLMRLLHRHAESAYWWEAPPSRYHEAVSLVLWDPARKPAR